MDERKDWSERLAKSPAEMTKEELAVWAMREVFALELKVAQQELVIRELRSRAVMERSHHPHALVPRGEMRERNLAIAAALASGQATTRDLAKAHGVTPGRIRYLARTYPGDVAERFEAEQT